MLFETCQDGLVLSVKACPGAKRNEVRYTDGVLKVYVTQVAERGKANEAIRKQLARSLSLRVSQVELLQGTTASQKKFLLKNVSADEVRHILGCLDTP